ncbi:MAG: long-chain fatty acid--CoA ligase, partial [Firmicutes bacterium]|nr:long-chain fatty acid--CoA ligase [Bacillota bacterium]
GDLGHLDKDNYIYITGRKKNVIITANGKNVFPEELEYHLQKSNYVEEAFVWADETERGDDKSIIATIRPNDDYFEEVLGHKPNEDEHQEILQKVVDEYNKDQPIYKRIGRLVVRTEDFDKTSASKIKRFAAENKRLD